MNRKLWILTVIVSLLLPLTHPKVRQKILNYLWKVLTGINLTKYE
jgi:hypothetical protein